MDFFAILDAGRTHYLSHYRRAIYEYRERFTPSSPEVLLDLPSSTSPLPYRLYRIDLASGAQSPPDLADLNTDPHADLASTSHEPVPGLQVILRTFVWNGLEFWASPAPKDEGALSHWVERWLDVNDDRPVDSDGLSGVIHSATQPELTEQGWSFSVDFGSAPMAALRELLVLLSDAGVTRLTLRSDS